MQVGSELVPFDKLIPLANGDSILSEYVLFERVQPERDRCR